MSMLGMASKSCAGKRPPHFLNNITTCPRGPSSYQWPSKRQKSIPPVAKSKWAEGRSTGLICQPSLGDSHECHDCSTEVFSPAALPRSFRAPVVEESPQGLRVGPLQLFFGRVIQLVFADKGGQLSLKLTHIDSALSSVCIEKLGGVDKLSAIADKLSGLSDMQVDQLGPKLAQLYAQVVAPAGAAQTTGRP